MTNTDDILIVGGYGEVGRRMAADLEAVHPGRVIVAGRHPERAQGMRSRHVDVDDPASIEAALDGVSVVVACIRQREPNLLRAAVHRGLAYTSIAPPRTPWSAVEELREEAQRSGARIVLATGIEPGISSVLARIGADRVGEVEAVETALLLGVGDVYGADSMAFLFEELAESYTLLVDGRAEPAHAFGAPKRVDFPAPVGTRLAYTIPFRDQDYYPKTLGARTSIARLALDPPWLGSAVWALTQLGARSWIHRGGTRGALRSVVERLQRRYAGRDRFALMVEVRGAAGVARSSLIGWRQAEATAIAAAATVEALDAREVSRPGVWLVEQVIAPGPFLERLAAHGLVPITEELMTTSSPRCAKSLQPTELRP
jgi:saccharopine dehydrogenase (NAD+, L-lysine-forming)